RLFLAARLALSSPRRDPRGPTPPPGGTPFLAGGATQGIPASPGRALGNDAWGAAETPSRVPRSGKFDHVDRHRVLILVVVVAIVRLYGTAAHRRNFAT